MMEGSAFPKISVSNYHDLADPSTFPSLIGAKNLVQLSGDVILPKAQKTVYEIGLLEQGRRTVPRKETSSDIMREPKQTPMATA
jgi:hypothetical protein